MQPGEQGADSVAVCAGSGCQDAVTHVLQLWGHLDMLVNNAAK